MSDVTRSNASQATLRACPYCNVMFVPKREQQAFCNDAHRVAYHRDVGTAGVVAAVSRIKRGVSVVIHFPNGPAAERAIKYMKGAHVRTVLK